MKNFLIFAGLITMIYSCFSQDYSPQFNKFINAIHQVESSGKTGVIHGDQGKSLGPLQISKGYWLDAKEYSKGKLTGKYSDVSDLTYAKKVVFFYMSRYERKALLNNEYEKMARCHNAGPNWSNKKKLTDKYWQKVKKNLEK